MGERLIDVNILVAYSSVNHLHHARARQHVQEAVPGSLLVCDVVRLGFVRQLSRTQVMEEGRLEPLQALRFARALLASAPFRFVSSVPDGMEDLWENALQGLPKSAVADTDLYLLAFAQALGVPFVTFDEALARRFPDADILVPA